MKRVLEIMLMVFVGIIFGLSSYAWLAPKNNSIHKIDINISSKVPIGTDSNNFKNIIDREDIINSNGIIQKDFYKVSTTLSKDKVKFFETNNDEINEILEKDGYYTVFDLYFKTDKILTMNLKTNIIYKGTNKDIENSIRIGFVYNDNNIILEPNYDKHSISSINNAYITNKLFLKEKDSKKQLYKAINNSKELESVDTINIEDLNLDKGINKVKVYIWIEEKDIDIYREVTGNYLNYIFNFDISK